MEELLEYNKKEIFKELDTIPRRKQDDGTYYHFRQLATLIGKPSDVKIPALKGFCVNKLYNNKGRVVEAPFISIRGIYEYLISCSIRNLEITAEYFGLDISDVVKQNALKQLSYCINDKTQLYYSEKLLRFVFEKRKTCSVLPMEITLDVFYRWIKSIGILNGDYPNSQKLETIRLAIGIGNISFMDKDTTDTVII